jgi:hypothetical protein
MHRKAKGLKYENFKGTWVMTSAIDVLIVAIMMLNANGWALGKAKTEPISPGAGEDDEV